MNIVVFNGNENSNSDSYTARRTVCLPIDLYIYVCVCVSGCERVDESECVFGVQGTLTKCPLLFVYDGL